MLSESEKQLCSELLKLLDVSTLYSLKDTITRHVIVAKTKKGKSFMFVGTSFCLN